MSTMAYSFGRTVNAPFEDVVSRAREALAAEGFGVLTEADIAGTLQTKIGVEMPPYVILGACNPPLANQALQAEPEIGTLLPCNVVVREDDQGAVTVIAMDPAAVLDLVGNADVETIAQEVKSRLERALAAI